MDNPLQKWILNVLRTQLGVKSTTPSWNILRECGIEPFQFNWFRATMRFYNSLTQCNSQLLKGVLHADIRLSPRNDSCWSSHLLSALDGLANSDSMRRQLMVCNPVNLNQFVVDLRSRHLRSWSQFSTPDPRDTNCRRLTYHQWCALPTREAHANHPPFTVPKYMFLDIPKEVQRSTARFRMRVHTLKVEQASWSPTLSPVCDRCDTGDIQDEKHVLFNCSHPQVCALRHKYAALYEQNFSFLQHHVSFRMPCTGTSHHVSSKDILVFLSQDNNKLPFFLHDLMCFYEQASSQTSWLRPFSPCNPCNCLEWHFKWLSKAQFYRGCAAHWVINMMINWQWCVKSNPGLWIWKASTLNKFVSAMEVMLELCKR